MTSENDTLMTELVQTIANRCFNGSLPGSPELIGLAIVDVCMPDARAEDLTHFMNLIIPIIETKQAEHGRRKASFR